MSGPIHKEFWCQRVRTCFDTFVKNPASLQHLLLFGPPGSGKTTSAQWLVEQIWKTQKALMCISMNAADERSLEAIRQKIFPFLRASWSALQVRTVNAPRFIILDECETLTEAAQLSLQTILDKDPKEVCVILICNSQSRIHPKLRQRLLRIRYDPPTRLKAGLVDTLSNVVHSTNDPPTRLKALAADTSTGAMLQMNDPPTRLKAGLADTLSNVVHSTNDPPRPSALADASPEPQQRSAFHEITRGDLRLSAKRVETEERLWLYLNHHPDELITLVRNSHVDLAVILTEILLLMNLLCILDESILDTINRTLPLISANVQMSRVEGLIKNVIQAFKQKIEEHLKQEGA
jgi:DNA polymerase III delta prime subunit